MKTSTLLTVGIVIATSSLFGRLDQQNITTWLKEDASTWDQAKVTTMLNYIDANWKGNEGTLRIPRKKIEEKWNYISAQKEALKKIEDARIAEAQLRAAREAEAQREQARIAAEVEAARLVQVRAQQEAERQAEQQRILTAEAEAARLAQVRAQQEQIERAQAEAERRRQEEIAAEAKEAQARTAFTSVLTDIVNIGAKRTKALEDKAKELAEQEAKAREEQKIAEDKKKADEAAAAKKLADELEQQKIAEQKRIEQSIKDTQEAQQKLAAEQKRANEKATAEETQEKKITAAHKKFMSDFDAILKMDVVQVDNLAELLSTENFPAFIVFPYLSLKQSLYGLYSDEKADFDKYLIDVKNKLSDQKSYLYNYYMPYKADFESRIKQLEDLAKTRFAKTSETVSKETHLKYLEILDAIIKDFQKGVWDSKELSKWDELIESNAKTSGAKTPATKEFSTEEAERFAQSPRYVYFMIRDLLSYLIDNNVENFNTHVSLTKKATEKPKYAPYKADFESRIKQIEDLAKKRFAEQSTTVQQAAKDEIIKQEAVKDSSTSQPLSNAHTEAFRILDTILTDLEKSAATTLEDINARLEKITKAAQGIVSADDFHQYSTLNNALRALLTNRSDEYKIAMKEFNNLTKKQATSQTIANRLEVFAKTYNAEAAKAHKRFMENVESIIVAKINSKQQIDTLTGLITNIPAELQSPYISLRQCLNSYYEKNFVNFNKQLDQVKNTIKNAKYTNYKADFELRIKKIEDLAKTRFTEQSTTVQQAAEGETINQESVNEAFNYAFKAIAAREPLDPKTKNTLDSIKKTNEVADILIRAHSNVEDYNNKLKKYAETKNEDDKFNLDEALDNLATIRNSAVMARDKVNKGSNETQKEIYTKLVYALQKAYDPNYKTKEEIAQKASEKASQESLVTAYNKIFEKLTKKDNPQPASEEDEQTLAILANKSKGSELANKAPQLIATSSTLRELYSLPKPGRKAPASAWEELRKNADAIVATSQKSVIDEPFKGIIIEVSSRVKAKKN